MHRVVLGAAVCVWVAGAAWWLGHGETHDASERPAPASGLPALQIAGHHRWTACPGGQRSPPPTPVLEIVGIGNGGLPGCGDGPGLTTVTPGLADDRATVTLRYTLTAPGTVRTEVCANRLSGLAPVWSRTQQAGAGMHAVSWRVPPSTGTGTYAVSVSATTSSGTATIGPCLTGGADRRGAVVRVVGIDAAFARRSYRPGQVARLSVTARASTIDAAMYLTGGGSQGGNDIGARQMVGAPMTTTTRIAWGSPDRVRRSTVALRLPAELQSGLYDVRLSAHGQVGYAPLVVRSPQPGATRIAVVAPTNTWAAYNFADPDGDGLANTWYAGSLGTSTVQLGLPFINGGAPPQWYRTDFLAWLATHGLHPDLLTDDDLEAIPNERRLAETYSAIIFAGHEEYVTAHEYDLIDGYRDLGGSLAFLSADSFFWRVDREGTRLRRIAQWRDLGRPEGTLVGVQYVANDAGQHRGPYRVNDIDAAPWLFRGTGLHNGSTFGSFGVEFDMLGPASPPQTALLARVDPHMPSGTVRGDMTFYRQGRSEVFAAGTESFFDSTASPIVDRMLMNLWQRWAARTPPLGGRY